MKAFLGIGESLGRSTLYVTDFSDHTHIDLSNAHLRDGERFLLDIQSRTPGAVLVGGSPIAAKVMQGQGLLKIYDANTGDGGELPISVGDRFVIMPNNAIYGYENTAINGISLVVRHTCIGYDPANSLPAIEIVQNLSGLMLG